MRPLRREGLFALPRGFSGDAEFTRWTPVPSLTAVPFQRTRPVRPDATSNLRVRNVALCCAPVLASGCIGGVLGKYRLSGGGSCRMAWGSFPSLARISNAPYR